MNPTLLDLLDACAGRRVLVIGDSMLDSYLEGAAGSICREAPVPVVTLSNRTDAPGGAANTAANVHSLGGEVTLLSVVGDDAEGVTLCRVLEERGISTVQVLVPHDRTTLAKHRIIAAAQMLVRFDQGSTGPVERATEQQLIDRLVDLFPQNDAVIISDYGYGVLTERVIQTLAELQARTPRVLVADAKRLDAYRAVGITAVKPNYAEAVRLLNLYDPAGIDNRVDLIAAHGARMLDITGAQIAAITLDTEGGLIFERGNPPYRIYARSASHARAAGAGDTFVSALTLALASGAPSHVAAELASAAASIVVASDGTVTCKAADLRDHLTADAKYVSDLARLTTRVDQQRQAGRRIVFTNGCFDIIHRGHVALLNRAKELGDVLVVAVNDDTSIRHLKGAGRPINTLADRVQVLGALSCIDYIVAFAADTPDDVIRAVRPDVLVKGGDYTRAMLPEADLVEAHGGSVVILPVTEEHSTSELIARIRATSSLEDPVVVEYAHAVGQAI